MCGIAGGFYLVDGGVPPELLKRMAGIQRHRGPDDEGYVFINTLSGKCEPRAGNDTVEKLKEVMKQVVSPLEFVADLAFGHRRLSIIDLSVAGHQPMCNEDGTSWIIHNGEIYNYIELRKELEGTGHIFRSNTDTEVILHSYEQWGVECLSKFNGMWAFAIWDSRKSKLFCSRDRFGIKPFYYYFDGERFLFASEIKALLEAEFVKRKPNNSLIYEYLLYGVEDSSEETFFSGIKHLQGGHYLEFRLGTKEPVIKRYYDIPLNRELVGLTDDEYAQRFYELFKDSIRLRLRSDVPVGSCLSGGLDSSSIVCMIDKLMREYGIKIPGREGRQKTFSARYEDKRHDEGLFIHDVIKCTSVDNHDTYPTAEGLCRNIHQLLWHQEQPFGSTSIYAQWEVFNLIKQSGVKVALDGQGGDEILAGYHIYFSDLFSHLARTFHWQDLLREYSSYIRLHGKSLSREFMLLYFHLLPENLKRLMRKATRVNSRPWLSKEFIAMVTGYPAIGDSIKFTRSDFFDQQLYESVMITKIPRLLSYEDKNSMAHSIESRVPFLDYRLVEFAFTLPWHQKIHRGTTKFILRNAMQGLLPESVASRQDKIGFSTPEDDWLRTDLRNEVFDIINSQSFQQRPYFNKCRLKQEFNAYQKGHRNNWSTIWSWINLELWLRMFIDSK